MIPAIILALAFLSTAFIAVWAAYDRPEAWFRFSLLTAGITLMIFIVVAGWHWGDRAMGLLAAAAAGLAGALALFFLFTFNWVAANPNEFLVLHQVGLLIQRARPGLPVFEDITPNVAGGFLAILIPLGLAGVLWLRQQRYHWLLVLATAVALLCAFCALVLTGSRGAWTGLLAAMAVFAYLQWRKRPGRPALLCRLGDGALLVALPLLLVALLILGVNTSAGDQWLGSLEGASGRADLWRQGLELAADYPFTGVGLNSPMMALSSYVQLLHVGFIVYIHNMFLEIAVQQGFPALIIFLALLALAATNLVRAYRRGAAVLVGGAAGALVALVVHGMVDSHAYYTRLVVVTFAVIGIALGLGSHGHEPPPAHQSPAADRSWPGIGGNRYLVLLLALVTAAAVLFTPWGRAALQANLGAVAQTRAELSLYTWPDWPLQDELRRTGAVDLAPIVARYQAALAENPRNATANRRLGQIELSLGQYDAARQHLEAAYATAPSQRATRQMLAESYAIAGDLERASALLRTVDTRLDQVDARIFWYNHVGEPERAEWLRQAQQRAGQ